MRKYIYLLAVFAAVTFIFAGCGKKAAGPGEITMDNKDASSVEEFQTTIEAMAKSGKPYECTYTSLVEDISQTGKIYFAGEDKLRGDITMNMPETGETTTHVIKDGETQYIWTDGQPNGMKMTVTKEQEEEMKAQAGGADQQSVDMDMNVTMKCKKWSPDKSVLTPPSDVKFQDLTEMMKSFQGAGAGSAGMTSEDFDVCGICDQVPAGAARDSCKEANC